MTTEKKKNGRPQEIENRVIQQVSLGKKHRDHCEKHGAKGISAYIRKLIDEDMAKNG